MRRRNVLAAWAAILPVLHLGTPAWSQEAVSPAAGTQEEAPIQEARPGLYLGATSCAGSNCHAAPRPSAEADVLLTEYHLWSREDPHARAFLTLESDTSAVIARNLGLGSGADEAPACLACHALDPPRAQLAQGPLDLDEGVSCEACHGPASGWRDGHAEASIAGSAGEDAWSHRDSVAAGMLDLRSAAVRGALCLSCHQGEAGKSVDHELIAAGHPVLRFELDNYAEAPGVRHWKVVGAKEDRTGYVRGAPAWAAGQLAALAESLAQVARRARSGPWPEFAEMRCESCHHALGEERWRTPRTSPGRAGEPPWSPARWAVARHVAEAAAPEEAAALDEALDRLGAGIARLGTPPAVVAEAAEEARDLARSALAKTRGMRWEASTAERLARAVAGAGKRLAAADQPSAEQAAWALRSLLADLGRRDRAWLADGVVRNLEAVAAEAENREGYDAARFADRLEALRAALP